MRRRPVSIEYADCAECDGLLWMAVVRGPSLNRWRHNDRRFHWPKAVPCVHTPETVIEQGETYYMLTGKHGGEVSGRD